MDVIPGECDAAVLAALPVFCASWVVLIYGVEDMHHIFFTYIVYTKVVDNQCELDVFCDMFEEARCMLDLIVSMLSNSFL